MAGRQFGRVGLEDREIVRSRRGGCHGEVGIAVGARCQGRRGSVVCEMTVGVAAWQGRCLVREDGKMALGGGVNGSGRLLEGTAGRSGCLWTGLATVWVG